MQTETIKNNSKAIAYVNLPCLGSTNESKDGLISCLSNDIIDSDNGYAGFSTRENLNNYLREALFDKNDNDNRQYSFTLDSTKITKVVTETVKKCYRVLSGGIIEIFVFPTFNQFVKDEMFGTTGYTPWKDTIFIFINSDSQSWPQALSKTIGHEFNHAVFFREKKCETLLESLIFEGLAEHFREQVIGGGQAPWIKTLELGQIKATLSKMKSDNLLSSTDLKLYHGVFFGNDKYVQWTGYALGYYLVKVFLLKNQDLKWPEIMNKKISEILEGSDF